MQLSISLQEMMHITKSLQKIPDFFYRLLHKEITMTTGTLISYLLNPELVAFLRTFLSGLTRNSVEGPNL